MPLTYSFGINHLTDILLFLSLVLLYNCMNHSKNSEGLVDKKKSVHVLVTQSCPILCNPMDCSPPGSTVQRIFQARILEWIAIPFSNTICEGQKKQTSKGSSMPLLFGPEGEAITQGGLLITTWKIGSQSSRCCSAEYLSKAR